MWLYDLERHPVARLTSTAEPKARPTWSADGRQIAFVQARIQVFDVYVKTVDTTEPEELSSQDRGTNSLKAGRERQVSERNRSAQRSLGLPVVDAGSRGWCVRARGSRTGSPNSRRTTNGSPTCDESGNPRGVRRADSRDRRQMAGLGPRRRAAALAEYGRELLYVSAEGLLMAVPLTASGWEGPPHAAFPPHGARIYRKRRLHRFAGRQRIVVNTFISDPVVPPIDVVVNWPVLLKR